MSRRAMSCASVERLREPMQKITDYVLRCAGVEPSAEVLPFERADRPRRGAKERVHEGN